MLFFGWVDLFCAPRWVYNKRPVAFLPSWRWGLGRNKIVNRLPWKRIPTKRAFKSGFESRFWDPKIIFSKYWIRMEKNLHDDVWILHKFSHNQQDTIIVVQRWGWGFLKVVQSSKIFEANGRFFCPGLVQHQLCQQCPGASSFTESSSGKEKNGWDSTVNPRLSLLQNIIILKWLVDCLGSSEVCLVDILKWIEMDWQMELE